MTITPAAKEVVVVGPLCLDCQIPVSRPGRCHRCAAEHVYRVSEIDQQMLALHNEGHSLSEIGRRFGVTKSRAQQRVARARGRGTQ